MDEQWLYVSRSKLTPAEAAAQIDDIVEVARAGNARLGVTGTLIFTGRHFAQYIEGSPEAVAKLRRMIVTDPRHCDIITLAEGPIPARRFATWSLAYAGPSQFVARTVAFPIDDLKSADRRAGVNKLLRLMDEFVLQYGKCG